MGNVKNFFFLNDKFLLESYVQAYPAWLRRSAVKTLLVILLACSLVYLLACLLVCFLVLGCLLRWLVDRFVSWLVGFLLTHLLACSLAGLFACLLGWLFDWLLACVLAWLTCEARAVEHQKLNQTTPYGVVWLSFWCSTYSDLAWASCACAWSGCLYDWLFSLLVY